MQEPLSLDDYPLAIVRGNHPQHNCTGYGVQGDYTYQESGSHTVDGKVTMGRSRIPDNQPTSWSAKG